MRLSLGLALQAARANGGDYTYSAGRYVFGDSYYHDTVTADAQGSGANAFVKHDPFARLKFTTSATEIGVDVIGATGGNDQIGVRVNGVHYSQHLATAYDDTVKQLTIALPAGTDKTIELIEASQGTSAIHNSIVAVRETAGTITPIAKVAPTNRIVVYGDSIAAGYSSTIMTDLGWTALLRWTIDDYDYGLTTVAYGGRRLYYDTAGGGFPTVAEFAAKLVSACQDVQPGGAKRLVMAIGTNDYGLASAGVPDQTAANFGTQYAALLDAINALDADIDVFCLTPLQRTTETANANGDTLGAYRTQIATAVSTRTAFATLIDGTTQLDNTTALLNTGTDLADAVHPNDGGHVKVFTKLRAYLLNANAFKYSELLDTPGVTAGIWNRTNTVDAAAVDGLTVLNEGTGVGVFHYVNQVPDTTIMPVAPMTVEATIAADTADWALLATNSGAQYVQINLTAGTLSPHSGTHISAPTITPVTIGARQFYRVRMFVTRASGNDVRLYVLPAGGAVAAHTGTDRQIIVQRMVARPLVAPDVYVATTSAAIG